MGTLKTTRMYAFRSMVKFNAIGILAAAIVAGDWRLFATANPLVRGEGASIVKRRRWYMRSDDSFVLYLREMEFPDHDEETWCCEIPQDAAESLGISPMICDFEGISQESIETAKPLSGNFIMKAEGAYVEMSSSNFETKIVVPRETSIIIEEMSESDSRKRRRLASSLGPKTVLVIRATDGDGVSPTATLAELESDI